jgi:hypothetical protein
MNVSEDLIMNYGMGCPWVESAICEGEAKGPKLPKAVSQACNLDMDNLRQLLSTCQHLAANNSVLECASSRPLIALHMTWRFVQSADSTFTLGFRVPYAALSSSPVSLSCSPISAKEV